MDIEQTPGNRSSSIRSDLEGRSVIVTGAGRGLGRWIALGFAQVGARVALIARTRSDLDETADTVRSIGADVHVITADVSDPNQCEASVISVHRYFGGLDVLVNNAGTTTRKSALETTVDDFNRMVDTNFRGTYFCCQAAGKLMVTQRRGAIINVASTSAFLVRQTIPNSVYGPTKAAVVMLTKALAAEWAPVGIRVNCVAPGRFQTPLADHLAPAGSTEQQEVLNTIPLGRLGEAPDILGPVLFFASSASAYVTGQTLFVDGGRTIL